MTVDLAKLPTVTLPAGTQLFRIHRADRGAWYFDGSGGGRFDPVGANGRGACYWGDEPLSAWVEVFRTRMLLPESEIARRKLSIAMLVEDLELVNLSDRLVLRAGVTASIATGRDYGPAHDLATALQGQAAGIVWRVRHDLAQQLLGVAIFGPAGPGDDSYKGRLASVSSGEIPPELVEDACAEFGYEALPDPPR